MAFKFVVADELLSVPYLTLTTDSSSHHSCFCSSGCHWVVANSKSTCAGWTVLTSLPGLDSGYPNIHSTRVKAKNTQKAIAMVSGRVEYPYNPTPDACLAIHCCDRAQMLIHAILIFIKYVSISWIYYHSAKYEGDGTLVDLAGLSEFQVDSIRQNFDMVSEPVSRFPEVEEVEGVDDKGVKIEMASKQYR